MRGSDAREGGALQGRVALVTGSGPLAWARPVREDWRRRARTWSSATSTLGHLGEPQEYADTVVHLAGEHYLVGQVISPNGGCVI